MRRFRAEASSAASNSTRSIGSKTSSNNSQAYRQPETWIGQESLQTHFPCFFRALILSIILSLPLDITSCLWESASGVPRRFDNGRVNGSTTEYTMDSRLCPRFAFLTLEAETRRH